MKNIFHTMLITAGGIAVLSIASFFVFYSTQEVSGEAFTGTYTTLATTSTVSVGPNRIATTTSPYNVSGFPLLFATSTNCTSRVITTGAQAIAISFGALSSTTLSVNAGHLQLASTTVAYDSGVYGCGLVTAYGYAATTTVTVSEFR